MKALLIEDEKAAAKNFIALLTEAAPEIEITAVIDSIRESIAWFRENSLPDIVFMDIHLADGSAFEIFEHVSIRCPIIFTTAYDEYALKAFKVNSIDYLLKPVGKEELKNAISKLALLSSRQDKELQLEKLISTLQSHNRYKTHFLIPDKGDKLIPISVDEIQYFHLEDGNVKAVMDSGQSYIIPQNLDELASGLDPDTFFRVNRQCILSRRSIHDIDLWFNNRLSINLKIPTVNKILVSRLKVAEFKEWFSGSYKQKQRT